MRAWSQPALIFFLFFLSNPTYFGGTGSSRENRMREPKFFLKPELPGTPTVSSQGVNYKRSDWEARLREDRNFSQGYICLGVGSYSRQLLNYAPWVCAMRSIMLVA